MAHIRSFCVILLTLTTLFVQPMVQAQGRQSLEALKTQLTAYLQSFYKPHARKVSVEVNKLDPRLRLAPCNQALHFEVRDLQLNGGAISVKTQCPGPKPWAIYVGAKISLYRQVLVAAHRLKVADIVNKSDIKQQLMNTSLLRQGYLVDSAQVIGQQVRRPLDPGEALRSGVLAAPIAVKRGERITLESTMGSIKVITQAEALNQGHVGEQIRVRNTTSKRIVHAKIIAKGRVAASY